MVVRNPDRTFAFSKSPDLMNTVNSLSMSIAGLVSNRVHRLSENGVDGSFFMKEIKYPIETQMIKSKALGLTHLLMKGFSCPHPLEILFDPTS